MDKKSIDACEEILSHAIIVLNEKKSEYMALNNQRINVPKYKVDGCIYKSSSDKIRCDYLLKANQKLYFIELKGSDIKKGLKQVLLSIVNLEQFFDHNSLNARVITTRGTKPKRLNTYKEYRDLIKLIGKGSIILNNTPYQETIN
tara:strand:+ start:8939 stop:9373 length:435 start_codon:yes stop_codon:yes gene_type:complete